MKGIKVALHSRVVVVVLLRLVLGSIFSMVLAHQDCVLFLIVRARSSSAVGSMLHNSVLVVVLFVRGFHGVCYLSKIVVVWCACNLYQLFMGFWIQVREVTGP